MAVAAKKPVGSVTRGTTNPNRLRRVDRFIAALPALRKSDRPVVVDLGYGGSPITAIELRDRLIKIKPSVLVVGIEIERERVGRGKRFEDLSLRFLQGGFETPLPDSVTAADVIRAFNVLRQYSEDEVPGAWQLMQSRLSEDGLLIEGTCDELGRISSWITLDRNRPLWFTISLKLDDLEQPSKVAERLPKALIHHNVPGEKIHSFLRSVDQAWRNNAPLATFSASQRWQAACAELKAAGWPVITDRKRNRLGELTINWDAVDPSR